MSRLWVLVLTFISFNLQANDFNERFTLVRDENGALLRIIDTNLTYNVSFSEFIFKTLDEYESEMDGAKKRYRKKFLKMKSTLLRRDVRGILNDASRGVNKPPLGVYQTMSDLRSPKEREKKPFMGKLKDALKWVAKKAIGKTPYVGDLLKFLMKKYFIMYQDANFYNRGVLLYYLENYRPSELGMTNEEVDLAMSDIHYQWSGFFKRMSARKNWQIFGRVNTVKALEKKEKKLKRTSRKCRERKDNISAFFNWCVNKKGEHTIVNTWDFINIQTTLNVADSEVVYKKRKAKEFICMLNSTVNKAVCKNFYKQIRKEGLVLAHLMKGNASREIIDALLKQSLNKVIKANY